MAFRMRGAASVTNSSSYKNTKSQGEKTVDELVQETKIQKRGDRFLYYPSELSTESLKNIKTKSAEDYLKDNCLIADLAKPAYTEEEFVYDSLTNKWKLVNKATNTFN